MSFTDKVQDVETALKSRSAAQRDIKTKWAAVVKLLQKYDLSVPTRRPDPSTVVGYVRSARVYLPQPEMDKELREIAQCDGYYRLEALVERPDLLKVISKQFTGFTDWIDQVREAKKVLYAPREVDEEATKAAQDEMSAAVDAYLASIEAYDDTLESVANVKEYIGIVKEIADISAIAQGIKTNN